MGFYGAKKIKAEIVKGKNKRLFKKSMRNFYKKRLIVELKG